MEDIKTIKFKKITVSICTRSHIVHFLKLAQKERF